MEAWNELQVILFKIRNLIENIDIKKKYLEILRKNELEGLTDKFIKAALDSKFLKQMPDSYNIGINDGEAAGQTLKHLHIQIIPRYFGDVKDPTGGVRNVIPGKGNYKK
ncbi:MAG TPA: HIT domain-containing protein [Candidatus Dojkabacteria bacterium]|nr:HIT domain-containing protein [Candidatus Dojkabacteria bacterium]